jgi:KipI family sensor histidine kinase inhibitor
MRFLDYGSSALLVELDGAGSAVALHHQLDAAHPIGVIETMPGLRTVLIRFDPDIVARGAVADLVTALGPPPAVAETSAGTTVQLRVDYSGPDLDFVADHCALSVADVVAAHQKPTYQIVLIGMAPGFYFLAPSASGSVLTVPRRASPRTDVPKGALGLAGELTGIYPRTGPGGWQLIGRVVDELWHPTRVPAPLLAPGTTVRFVAA